MNGVFNTNDHYITLHKRRTQITFSSYFSTKTFDVDAYWK